MALAAIVVGALAAGMLVSFAGDPPLLGALALACLMLAVFSALMLAGATPGPAIAIAAAVSYAVKRADARPGPWLWVASGLFAIAALSLMVAREPFAVMTGALALLLFLGLVFLLVLAPMVVHWVRSRLGKYDRREPEGWELFRLLMAEAENWRCGAFAVVCLLGAIWACLQWHSLVLELPRLEDASDLWCMWAIFLVVMVGLWHREEDEFLLAFVVWFFLTVLSGGWFFSLVSS